MHTKGFTLRELSERAGLKKDSLKNALYRSCPKYERIIAMLWCGTCGDLAKPVCQ
ncbi:helix-turn-helix domain-containing protein [Escherichia coli]|uniref:helix-turn-helix domain-containing protein n=1 Tax=Escherichia coli TaxID=562 RepID=UPI003B282348